VEKKEGAQTGDADDRVRELEAEVRRLNQMLESAPDFITRITRDGRFLYLNRLAPGYRLADVLGTSVDAYVPPEFRERAHQAIRDASTNRTMQEYSTMGRTSVERVGHYLTRVSPIIEDGEVDSLVMIATDVTALQENRLLLQVALDAGGLGTWTYDARSGSLNWDDRTRRMLGVPEGEVDLVTHMSKAVHPDDRPALQAAFEQARSSGRFGPVTHRVLVGEGAGWRWVHSVGLAVRGADGELVQLVGSVQDVTETRAMEARLFEAQKLESIGRLAGGVAHDFNNMLMAILGNVEFARYAESPAEADEFLASIRLAAERSAALTAQLLAFAQRQVLTPQILDPNTLVARIESLFRSTIGERIRVQLALNSRWRVSADESRLEQVVANLATNARDAMPEGGTLTLATQDVTLGPEAPELPPGVGRGQYVVVVVADTGVGISAEVLPHVFEPFYTTRVGGTGLGLATCYGIVKQFGGQITVNTELGRGTRFSVYLPRAEGDLVVAPSESPVMSARGERILLIEDELEVRTVIERTLKAHGYNVVTASNAEEALNLFAASSNFDLLVTDIVLPGINGKEVAEKLTQAKPSLQVLFMSGYTEDTIAHDGVLEPLTRFLQKPFSPRDLLGALSGIFRD
jgi:PAS domain S-box-containing protein